MLRKGDAQEQDDQQADARERDVVGEEPAGPEAQRDDEPAGEQREQRGISPARCRPQPREDFAPDAVGCSRAVLVCGV